MSKDFLYIEILYFVINHNLNFQIYIKIDFKLKNL